MISGQVRRSRRTGVLLLATLFAAVVAVFVMHALTSHHHTHSGSTAQPLPGVMAAAEHQHSGHGHTGEAGSTTLSNPELPGSDHGSTGVVCWALLYVVAAFIAVALRRGIPSRVLFAIRRWAPSRALPWARSAEPPCLHRLSILRC